MQTVLSRTENFVTKSCACSPCLAVHLWACATDHVSVSAKFPDRSSSPSHAHTGREGQPSWGTATETDARLSQWGEMGSSDHRPETKTPLLTYSICAPPVRHRHRVWQQYVQIFGAAVVFEKERHGLACGGLRTSTNTNVRQWMCPGNKCAAVQIDKQTDFTLSRSPPFSGSLHYIARAARSRTVGVPLDPVGLIQ